MRGVSAMLAAIWLTLSPAGIALSAGGDGATRTGGDAVPDFYVAPGPVGSDAADCPGTKDRPFATLARARDAVRALVAAGLNKDVLVSIRGETYELDAPLAFGPLDSGTKEHSITYAAAPGEKVVISGGRRIIGWKRGDGNVWAIELPEVKAGKWHFRQLFVNDKRVPRSRFPKGGDWLTVKTCSPDFKVLGLGEGNLPAAAQPGGDLELLMPQQWSISRAMVAAIDAKLGTITSATPIGWIGHGPYTCASPGKRFCLESSRSFLDQPWSVGAWCLERASGTLSYRAADGENPNELNIVAPRLEQLVTVDGLKDKPVRNLRFVGLSFEHTEFPMPPFGYSEVQAGHYGPGVKEPINFPPVAIQFVYAADCRVERCRVAHMGSAGVGLGAGCQRNSVTCCRIVDIGGNGVMVGWRGKGKLKQAALDADWDDPVDAPAGNEVANNLIARCGAFSFGSVGVHAAFSADTRIAHNEIFDMPYDGVSIGFRWNTTPTTQCRCLVEYNHIHDVMGMLADGGGIYSLGLQPGTVIRGNHIHDVLRSKYALGSANNGMFIDEGSKGFLFEKNVIYRANGGPIRFNNCKREDHTFRANCFDADVQKAAGHWAFGDAGPSNPKPADVLEETKAKAGLEPQFRGILADEK